MGISAKNVDMVFAGDGSVLRIIPRMPYSFKLESVDDDAVRDGNGGDCEGPGECETDEDCEEILPPWHGYDRKCRLRNGKCVCVYEPKNP